MQHGFTLESKLLAEELHDLLRSLDPVTWRDDLASTAHSRFDRVMARLKAALSTEVSSGDSRLHRIRETLDDVARLAEHAPPSDQPAAQLRHGWQSFRGRAYPTYDALAASLRHEDIHVPVLRPTNYYRNAFHVSSGLVAFVCIQHLVSPSGLIWIACSFAAFCWIAETVRRFSPAANRVLMSVFAPMAHRHEYHQVNSATWYATALVLLAVFGTPLAATVAVVVLAVGDPVAALIGRRFGRTKIRSGRSLEGSLAFLVASGLALLAVLRAYYPAMGLTETLILALGSAVAGSLAELYSQWTDDNFTIPLAVGTTVSVMTLWVV